MEETRYTYCRICEASCGLKATLKDGKLQKVAANKEHLFSRGYICARGMASVDIHQDPDRIKYPMKRVNGEFQRVSWEEALGDIGRRLKAIREQYGPHAVAVYFGNPIAFDYAFSTYMPLGINALRTRNIYSAGSQDCNNKFAAAEQVYGSPLLQPIPDVDNMDFLIIWGSNPTISKMSFISLARPEERLKAIEKRGGRVILIDPRKNETARMLGEHIFIRPDTDIYLMMAMLQVIFSENLYNVETVRRHTRGVEELQAFVADCPPEKAAAVTGIKAEVITALARDFARAENAGIHCSLGVNLSSFGTLGYWLVQALNAVTGRLDKSRSMIFCFNLLNFPRLMKMATRNRMPRPSRVGNMPPVMDTLPAGILADEILTPGEGQIKALIVLSGNPLLTVPDTDKLETALKSLDLVVSGDLFINETGGLSDYVLPSKDFYEHWDFAITNAMFNPTSALNFTEGVVKAEGERRELWIIFHDLLAAAGYPLAGLKGFAPMARLLDFLGRRIFCRDNPWSFRPRLMLRLMLLASGISWKKLKNSPHGMRLKDHQPGQFYDKLIQTEDKKINLAPEEFIAEKGSLDKFFEQEQSRGGFKLINQRQRRTHNSWLHNVKSFVEKEGTNFVSLNREDAARLGIAEGDLVEVKTGVAAIEIPARLVDTLMPGVVCIPHGWGHDKASGLNVARQFPGVNVNRITASGAENLEKFAGMAKLTGIPVEIARKE